MWVGIVAGAVFVVGVIFFSGFFLGWSSSGHYGTESGGGRMGPNSHMGPGGMSGGMMGPGRKPGGMMGPRGPMGPASQSPTTTQPAPRP